MPFGGVIKESAKNSKPWWPPRVVPPKGAPNVLLIMTDEQVARRKLLVLDAVTELRVLAIIVVTISKPLRKSGQVNTASGSTTSGASVSSGRKETRSM